MKRPAFNKFKEKALSNPEVKKEYESLLPGYELRKNLITMRKSAGLTQEALAEILCTNKSNISRLENAGSEYSPKLSTIEKYAKALGYRVEITFREERVNPRPNRNV